MKLLWKQGCLWLIFLFVTCFAQADPGNGIVADSKGNIFYTDLSQVWKIDVQGNKTLAVPNVHTHELYLDKNDNLFGEHLWYNGETANTWGHYVWKLDAAGKLEKIIKDTTGFLEWYSFVRDDAGNMYYTEQSIPTNFWKIAPDGKRTLLGSASFRHPGRLHVHKGIVYLYNHDDIYTIREGDSLQLFRSNLYEGKDTCDRCMESVFSDTEDNIYAAVSANKLVKKIGVDGAVSVVHRSEGDWFPTGGVVDKNKTLRVLEANSKNEVRVVKASVNSETEQNKTGSIKQPAFNWIWITGLMILVALVFFFSRRLR